MHKFCYIYPHDATIVRNKPRAKYICDIDKVPECYVRSMAILDAACCDARDTPYIEGIGCRTQPMDGILFYYLDEII